MGHDELIGKTLRQYLVTGHIGQGGMGDVWKARDTVLERDVALKVLLAHDSAAIERKERFAREARAASALNHPNIITIYEINSDQGIDFIAMEYVRGQTLGLILRAGPLPVERVVGYALQIAEAVGRAHGAGIVHRDLKPGNIMVTDDDDLVKVLDFGLAKVARPASHEAESPVDAATRLELTRPGTSSGTFGYMSPEQSVGDAIDARSDVFSFGVVMYEMLAGQRPFEATSRVDALKQLHFSTPEPVTSVRPDTPQAIAAIVSRALQKRPSDRYANLTQVATALRMALSTVPVSSVGAEPAAQPSHRRRYAIMSAVGASAIVIGAIVIGAVAWQSRAIDRNGASQVGTPPARESAGVYELTQNAAGLLARQDIPDNVDQAIAFLEQALALDRDSAAAHSTLSTAYLRKNQINPDPQWAALARQSAERAVAINADLAIAQQALGFVRLEAGDRVQAAERFRRAVDLDPMSSLPHMGLGLIAAAENREAEAEAAFQKAVQLGPKLWRPRLEYGQFHFRRARYAEAVAQWEAAETTTPDNVLVLRSLGAAYFLLDRPDEAASILQRALEARPSAAIYTNLGTIRFFQRRYADAVEAFEKAVELGANNQQFWGNLGDGLRWAPGRRPEAAAAYRRASELIQQQIADTPDNPDLRSRHALYLIKVGDRAAALREIAGVVNRSDLNAQMHYRLAVIHELAGDRTQALAALERALKAGYAAKDLPNEPELVAMRADARYHRMVDAFKTPGNR